MSTKFCVLENDRPACYPTKAECWHNWKFDDYMEAFKYAKAWLGPYEDSLTIGKLLSSGKFVYNGIDSISIVEISVPV